MSKEIQVPDYLKSMMDEGAVQDSTAQLMAATGGVPRLTTRGKTFRFKEGEDEEKSGQSVDVIIVGTHPTNGLSHTFYKESYSNDSNSPPDCSSMNGVTPDPWITEPYSDRCATCPNQAWGSAKSMSGGKAKACRDSKQLYVAKASDFAKDPEQATLYLFQVTVNSLKALTNYGKQLAQIGIPGPQFVITRMSFDEEASVPKVEFECLGALNEKLGKASYARSEKKEWDAISKLPPPQASNDKRSLPKVEEVKSPDLDSTDTESLINDW